MTKINDQILTDKELCEMYKISSTTSWRFRRRKNNPLPYFFCGDQVRYRLAEVVKFFEVDKVGGLGEDDQ